MALSKNPKYDLKMKYKRTLEIGIILSLSLLIIAFKYFPNPKHEKIVLDTAQELVKVEDVISTKQEAAPPPPPKPAVPIEAPIDSPLEDIVFEDTDLDVNEIVAAPPPPLMDESQEEIYEEPVFFVAVEEMPVPIGGIKGIQQRIVYPVIAKRAGIHGRVYVLAYVDENGNVTKVELLKGIGGGCDEAAINAVEQTKFSPGKQRGKPVKVKVSVPILFRLEGSA